MDQEKHRVEKGLSFKKNTAKAIDAVRAMPRAFVSTAPIPYEQLDDSVHDQLVRELHTYPQKNGTITRLIWVLGGYIGLHRFYLGQVGYGFLMLCTLGGALIWWIVDGFYLNKLVNDYNLEQAKREAEDLPPIGMDYVPVATPDALLDEPAWASKRLLPKGRQQGKARYFFELLSDFIALMFFGFVLGSVTNGTDHNTAIYAVIAIVVMINFADYLIPWHDWPIVRGLIHWDYRLRLFYHFNEPGRRLQLYFRPLLALLYAPFRKKARNEVILYLELGSIFIAGRILMGLIFGDTWEMIVSLNFSGFMESFVEGWFKGIIIGFFTIYGFASPIGALMMKHVLLRRPNYVRWGLSFAVLFFLFQGFYSS